ncbi:MAG: hypothetical protein NTX04_06595 [Verrucomicrobia bacterium]|nr:hypothetical protein [Verrucomicrobiota bacterium]
MRELSRFLILAKGRCLANWQVSVELIVGGFFLLFLIRWMQL